MRELRVRCACGKVLSVAAEHRGRSIKCKHCGRVLQVPDAPGFAQRVAVVRGWLGTPRAVRVVSALAWAYAGGALLAAILLWTLGDVSWIGTIVLFIGRWILLTPLLLLVPAAWIAHRRSLAVLAGATIVIAGPVMGGRVGWRALGSAPEGVPLRVVTYNANIGAAVALEFHQLLDDWRADVVAIQECGELLREAVRTATGWYSHQVRDLCFLSRYPILDSAVMDRSAFARVHEADYEGIGGAADVVRYRVETPAGDVSVTNLHLETPRKGLEGVLGGALNFGRLRDNTTLRRLEALHARRWVEAGGHPLVVLGDFNTPVESTIYREHWGTLTNAFSHVGTGFGFTRLNGWIRVRIDHVLAGPGVVPVRVTLGRGTASDHLPVIADLVITRGLPPPPP